MIGPSGRYTSFAPCPCFQAVAVSRTPSRENIPGAVTTSRRGNSTALDGPTHCSSKCVRPSQNASPEAMGCTESRKDEDRSAWDILCGDELGATDGDGIKSNANSTVAVRSQFSTLTMRGISQRGDASKAWETKGAASIRMRSAAPASSVGLVLAITGIRADIIADDGSRGCGKNPVTYSCPRATPSTSVQCTIRDRPSRAAISGAVSSRERDLRKFGGTSITDESERAGTARNEDHVHGSG